ncbi:MAG: methylated-DNA--[protein]-cysteine S-methyltransferase [Calditrichaeota bacterium]|nr:methylated-DNA--[protein]-cysteine S-methyltransferase [Calditrichota bacterium]MCB0302781.1 methylated-DNA--[protein]-cysteine S-methyltransferase [Calditrichota bacterium]MCB9090374.1 methylated-DNA--[protein]-cysteine S-methyltransferase [Calditrichia bacterium]
MSEPYQAFFSSEIGNIRITASETAIETLYFVEEAAAPSPEMPPVLQECLRQLEAYFRGELKDFSLKLQPQGTAFQQSVWQQLLEVPYGSTATYLDIARRLGDRNAVRAVGSANGRNPISLIIPCHRIIGANGRLIGYGGGLWRKEWLLRHEGALLV